MIQVATLTSKRQLTIPAEIFRKLGLRTGQKLIVREDEGEITLTPALNLVEDLAGSVQVPAKYKGLSADEIIDKSKKDYFSKK